MSKPARAFLLAATILLLPLAAARAADPQAIEKNARKEAKIATDTSKRAPVEGAPVVDPSYQRSINRAWTKAVSGESPANACAGLKGRLMSRKEQGIDAAARRALFACNVEAPVRYFETLLDQVEAGTKNCQEFHMAMATQLPAMTLSMSGIAKMIAAAETMEEDEQEGTKEMSEALTDEVMMVDRGLENPRREIQNRLQPRIDEVCR